MKPRHCPPRFDIFYFLFLCRNALLSARNVAVHSASVSAGTRRSVSPKEFLNQRCNYRPPSAQTQLDLRWLDKQMLPDSYKLYTYGQIIDLRSPPPPHPFCFAEETFVRLCFRVFKMFFVPFGDWKIFFSLSLPSRWLLECLCRAG